MPSRQTKWTGTHYLVFFVLAFVGRVSTLSRVSAIQIVEVQGD